jgi:hypothetical protein
MGPWYHNAFEIMKHIPFNGKGTIYELALARPLDFGIFPDTDKAHFYDGFKSTSKMFGMDKWEFLKMGLCHLSRSSDVCGEGQRGTRPQGRPGTKVRPRHQPRQGRDNSVWGL